MKTQSLMGAISEVIIQYNDPNFSRRGHGEVMTDLQEAYQTARDTPGLVNADDLYDCIYDLYKEACKATGMSIRLQSKWLDVLQEAEKRRE